MVASTFLDPLSAALIEMYIRRFGGTPKWGPSRYPRKDKKSQIPKAVGSGSHIQAD